MRSITCRGARDIDDVNLPIAQARDVGRAIAIDDHPERIFAARDARFAGSSLPGRRSSSAVTAQPVDHFVKTLMESL